MFFENSRHPVFSALFVLLLFVYSCKEEGIAPTPTPKDSVENIAFDSILASQLGADQYGMKTYVMAFLMAGPNRNQDSLERVRLQRAHLDNIGRLAEEKKLVLAGPFLANDSRIRGIYIFDTDSLEEAQKWTESDPAIQEGSLTMDLMLWYGSAALGKVGDIHTSIARINI